MLKEFTLNTYSEVHHGMNSGQHKDNHHPLPPRFKEKENKN
jgi:hypothetical protein